MKYLIKAAHLGHDYEDEFDNYQEAEKQAQKRANEEGITFQIDEANEKYFVIDNFFVDPEE